MTPPGSVLVRRLDAAEAEARLGGLADILVDAVAGGASISFMSPFGRDEAVAWWRGVLGAVASGKTALFGALAGDDLVGTVQLGLDMPPNQPHRGDVRKLVVHRRARGRGAGAALMTALEDEARAQGLTLLVLDTAGEDADRLYRRLGWTEAGTIPDYAMWPGGGFCDTTFFWKRL